MSSLRKKSKKFHTLWHDYLPRTLAEMAIATFKKLEYSKMSIKKV